MKFRAFSEISANMATLFDVLKIGVWVGRSLTRLQLLGQLVMRFENQSVNCWEENITVIMKLEISSDKRNKNLFSNNFQRILMYH